MATTGTEAAAPAAKGPTLHHLNNSQSQRILWLCEELRLANGFEYTFVNHVRNPKTYRAPPELTTIHPLGKSPTLVTTEGRAIVESSAIALYLIKTYDTTGQFSIDDWVRDEELVSFAGSSLGLFVMFELLLEIAVKQTPWPISYIVKALQKGVRSNFTAAELKKSYTYLEKELGDDEWFNGKHLGRSDVMLSWPLDNVVARNWTDFKKEYPKIGAWRERIENREAWKSALEKGNGYKLSEP